MKSMNLSAAAKRLGPILALSFLAYAPSSYALGTVPPTFFSMHIQSEVIGVSGNIPWPSFPSGGGFGGIRLWDTMTTWNDLNPARGTFNWSNLDAYLGLAQQHGVDVLYTFGVTPTWASSNPSATCDYASGGCYAPANISDWDNFVTNLVNHSAGRIKYYECWNEANQHEYWSDTIGNLVTLCQHMYTIVHQLQPSALVLSPAGVGSQSGPADEVNAFFGNGGKGYADVVAFHGYPPCCSSYYDPEDIVQNVGNLRAAMDAQGVGNLPYWDTEGSWGVAAQISGHDSQAWASRFEILHWSLGVGRHYWYAWNDTDFGTLYNMSSQTITPAGDAYGQTYLWLNGRTMNTPCAQNGNVWTCGLTGSNGYQALIVWNTSGNSSYSVPSGYASYRDLSGNTHSVSGSVTIGQEPILLESSGSPPPPPAPTVSVSANPISLTLGQSTTLSWSSTNSTSCNASGAWSGSKATSGSQAVTPTSSGTNTFTLTCTGSGGSASQSASVSVAGCPPPPSCAAPPADCAYQNPVYDKNSCLIGCGTLTCAQASCSPSSQSVNTGSAASVNITCSAPGCSNVAVSAPGGSPSSATLNSVGAAPQTFNATYSSAGSYNVTASDNLTGSTSVCSVAVSSPPPPPPPSGCQNPPFAITGWTLPCPVLSASPQTVSQSGGVLTITAASPTTNTYVGTTIYISSPAGWQPLVLTTPNPPAPGWSNTTASLTLSGTSLANIAPGWHFIAEWDWTWNGSCYLGPGAASCGQSGQWRLQAVAVQ